MNAVDQFVIYDNIQFTKKGWINRNRFLLNSQPQTFTLPLKKDSDYLDVSERYLSDIHDEHVKKLLRQFEAAYAKTPHFYEGVKLLRECLLFNDKNLFNFVYHSIKTVRDYLSIDTELVISSSLDIDHDLRSAEKVKAICHNLNADTYINPHGGVDLYDKDDFDAENLTLKFLKPQEIEYDQNQSGHTPWLSIIDLIMFCRKSEIQQKLSEFDYL
ncbi:WbqC-like protein [Methylophaga frappieri]|uniref:WbqC-like protein n=2 Tax=Methylophaga frappieri (strain ATCC BAA-2434 / DSM 25690 / JAM7) TaxID=754477 RepID=I1YG67_METFJ|nr:WbqC-like protein [Methylophaga frappieri]